MALHAVFGDMHFNNANKRDRIVPALESQAAARGLVAESYDANYPHGYLVYDSPEGEPSLKFYYVGTAEQIYEAADALHAFMEGNESNSGIFGTVQVTN